MSNDALVIQQLLAGRDFATGDSVAAQMVNFVYLIASTRSRKCVLIDPAWDIPGLLAVVDSAGYELAGALVTHYHPDHVGGDLWGTTVEGVAELVSQRPVKVFVHEREADGVRTVTGLDVGDLSPTTSGQVLDLDGVHIQFLHTPGHTPGSQCFHVNDHALVSGDTLFIGGCGRVDLPGGDDEELFKSLNDRLGSLPGSTIVYPGHHHGSAPSRSLLEERRSNPALVAPNLKLWRRMLGRG